MPKRQQKKVVRTDQAGPPRVRPHKRIPRRVGPRMEAIFTQPVGIVTDKRTTLHVRYLPPHEADGLETVVDNQLSFDADPAPLPHTVDGGE